MSITELGREIATVDYYGSKKLIVILISMQHRKLKKSWIKLLTSECELFDA